MANKISGMRFRKTHLSPKDVVIFDTDLLKLYLAVDEKKTVISLFKEVQLTQPVFKKCFIKLVQKKLIEPIRTESISSFNGSFLNRLRGVLISVSGPLGGILIEEVASEMQIDASNIPAPKLSDFVCQIADRIPGERQAAEFRRTMLAEIAGRGPRRRSSLKLGRDQ